MTSNGIYGEIIQRIKRIYDSYEEKANDEGAKKNIKRGNVADKA